MISLNMPNASVEFVVSARCSRRVILPYRLPGSIVNIQSLSKINFCS